MGESFLEQIENKLAAKAEIYRKDLRHERKLHTERMRRDLAGLRTTESELKQIRKARRLLEAAEGNES